MELSRFIAIQFIRNEEMRSSGMRWDAVIKNRALPCTRNTVWRPDEVRCTELPRSVYPVHGRAHKDTAGDLCRWSGGIWDTPGVGPGCSATPEGSTGFHVCPRHPVWTCLSSACRSCKSWRRCPNDSLINAMTSQREISHGWFQIFWKKKIQEISSPILEFSRCFLSLFAAEIYKIWDLHRWRSPFIALWHELTCTRYSR